MAAADRPTDTAPAALRVLTYNIHKGFSGFDGRFVLHAIREALRGVGPDLVFLQEIHGEHAGHRRRLRDWPEESQFEFLADRLWPHYAYGKNAIYQAGHHGNAILSRYPFRAWENFNLSALRHASRSVLHGVVGTPGGVLHVMCVHLDVLGPERRRQLGVLAELISTRIGPDEPLIVAGDFNDWRGRGHRLLTHELGLREAFGERQGRCARTFPAWLPLLRLDRIYYRGLEAIDSRRLDERHWRRLSDHAPLLATFVPQAAAPGR
ncbi:MAG: hypothetical protein KatS3mg121_0357 [Gammaproteobacteria bacterium]|nr:MAG: hypothetical protein KatS3mg121_0357 [Gammaproteobacteria bacterium]